MKLKNPLSNNQGQTLVMVLLIVVVCVIFVSALVSYLRQDSKWTVKQKKATIAFHLADAAMDRAAWKLKQNSEYWNQISSGIPLSGYNADTEYTDMPGGSYMIRIYIGTCTATTSQLIVTTSGRDSGNREVRSIKAVWQKTRGIPSSINAPAVQEGGNSKVHWGPIYSLGSITGASALYPRKWAVGMVDPRDNNSAEPNKGVGSIATPPVAGSSWEADWWEWKSYDPDVPKYDVDIAKYKALAIAQGFYKKDPAGNNYPWAYDSWAVPVGGDLSKVRFVEFTAGGNTLKVAGNVFISGTLIVYNGTLKFTGNGKGDYNWPIPNEAWKQYCAMDTANPNEWPGDTGLHSQAATYHMTTIKFHGFVYVYGTYDAAGTADIHGSIYVTSGLADPTGNTTIWYDSTVSSQILAEGPMSQTSWEEIQPQWPPPAQ